MNTILKYLLVMICVVYKKVLNVFETVQGLANGMREMGTKFDIIIRLLSEQKTQGEKICSENEKKLKEELDRLKLELENEKETSGTWKKKLAVLEKKLIVSETAAQRTVKSMQDEIAIQKADFEAEKKEFEKLRKKENLKAQKRKAELDQRESFLMDLVNCLKEFFRRQGAAEVLGSFDFNTNNNISTINTANRININTIHDNNSLDNINSHKFDKENDTHAVYTQTSISTPPPITQTEISGEERIENETNTQDRKRKAPEEEVESSQHKKSHSRAPALVNPLEESLQLSSLEVLAREANFEFVKVTNEEKRVKAAKVLPPRKGRGMKKTVT